MDGMMTLFLKVFQWYLWNLVLYLCFLFGGLHIKKVHCFFGLLLHLFLFLDYLQHKAALINAFIQVLHGAWVLFGLDDRQVEDVVDIFECAGRGVLYIFLL